MKEKLHISGSCVSEKDIGQTIQKLITEARDSDRVIDVYGNRNISYNCMIYWDESDFQYYLVLHVGKCR